ncbi:MAG: mechanosensitive ion channel family protein [Candidatus Omnitrophica bacterium]|nr:mechanosensitive ion channel family protein [Candidatus Omnitrophota bacterium]MBU4346228.1 mechanosensitive ion channel family protein [Candidatus Omnitrophota bacterium]MBU4473387.1 mechanosensitive ion channel family protein [Candidatus Omnitrophota bacterium]MCG2706972.1 mechanosensitive ion channel family protein [Candidatus Omnitrophota bacterium]
MQGSSKKISWEIIKHLFLPVIIFLLLLGLYVFYKLKVSIYISSQLQQEFKKYAATIFIMSMTFIIQRIAGAVCRWYKENIAAKTSTRLDDELIPLLRRVANIAIWVIALLIILPFYGVNISALIAALGVGSLAIALAAQDTIANIIAGFMIMVDRPFRPGDRIKLPSGEVVTVLDIGVRRSKFLSEDKAIIIVPNLELSKSKIINYTYGQERLGSVS